MLGDGLAKGFAAFGIAHTGFQRGTDKAGRAGCHGVATMVEARHGDLEAFAFLADAIGHRDFDIRERDPARGAGPHAQLAMQVAGFHAFAVQVHDKG